MTKKLTITIDDDVYEGLHRRVGRGRISHFLETLARPHVIGVELDSAYRAMAEDEEREAGAEEWAEGTVDDVASGAGRAVDLERRAAASRRGLRVQLGL